MRSLNGALSTFGVVDAQKSLSNVINIHFIKLMRVFESDRPNAWIWKHVHACVHVLWTNDHSHCEFREKPEINSFLVLRMINAWHLIVSIHCFDDLMRSFCRTNLRKHIFNYAVLHEPMNVCLHRMFADFGQHDLCHRSSSSTTPFLALFSISSFVVFWSISLMTSSEWITT